jgi:outer membrane receptor protein involved in Fe transport
MIESMNLNSLDDIAKVTAGLTFDPEFSRTSNRPVIRGQANILGASGVSYFIDGVYITGSINDYDINDVERIEVVKGPQSALYGRNTYSGAINIITKSPGEQYSGRVGVEFTDDSQTGFNASFKGPITENFSLGITGRYHNLSGAWTNTYDGTDIGEQESKSVSLVADYTPTERLGFRGRIYYSGTNDGQPPLFGQPASANNCFEDNGSLYGGLGRYYCGTIQPQAINTDYARQVPDARDSNDTLQTSLSINFDINDTTTLTSITGFNRVDSDFVIDGDYADESFATANFTPNGFPFDFSMGFPFGYGYAPSIVDFTFAGVGRTEDISQEIRVNWENERTSFLLGAYYFDQDSDNRDARILPADAQARADAGFGTEAARMQGVCAANPSCRYIIPFGNSTIVVPENSATSNTTNTAVFGMAAFNMTDATRITVEGRWAEEKIEQVATVKDVGSPPSAVVPAKATFTSFNPRITLDHQYGDNKMIYALVAQGNKPGGFNGASAIEAGLPSYDEEEVTSIEIGSKNVFAGGQLIANFAGYFNDIEGYQLTQNARTATTTTSAIVNAGDADVTGLEAELLYRPSAAEGLTLMFNYAYTNAEFTKGEDENLGLLLDVEVDGMVNCSLGDQFPDPSDPTACDTSKYGDISGKKIPRTAEHQVFFDAELRRPLGGGDIEYFIGANASYESSKFAQVANYAETGDATLLNARIGVATDLYTISIWGKNLSGEDSTPLVLRYADGNDSFKRSFVGTQRRDRYWGITATARFE